MAAARVLVTYLNFVAQKTLIFSNSVLAAQLIIWCILESIIDAHTLKIHIICFAKCPEFLFFGRFRTKENRGSFCTELIIDFGPEIWLQLQCPSLFERHWSQMNNQGAGYNKLSRDSFVHWGANVWGLKDVFCWFCVLQFWSNVCAPNHVQIALMLFYPLVASKFYLILWIEKACVAVISMVFMSILWMLLLKVERLQVGWIPRDTRWLKPRNSQVQSFGHDVMAKAMGPCCNMSGSQSKQKLIRCLLRCVFLLEMSLKTDVCQVQ